MQEIHQIAAAIDLRMRQLTAQGIKGPEITDHMFGYMAGLQRTTIQRPTRLWPTSAAAIPASITMPA